MAADRLERLQALKTANFELAFSTAFAALVGGNFQQAFALELGATPRLLALISALPAIIGVLQIPGSVVGEHFKSYKKFVAPGVFFWRFAWVPVALLPLAPAFLPRLSIFIGCIIFSAVSLFFVQATYNAWLSFLVPESHRGWYFSRRIAIATVVSVLIGLPASIALDWMDKNDDFRVGLAIIFGLGVVFAFISFFFYTRMPNTVRETESSVSVGESLRSLLQPLRDKKFVWLLVFLVVFIFAQTFAAPFFFPYGRQVLKLDFLQFQIFGAFHAAATLLSAPMWGYFSDKYGNKPVLFVAGTTLCLGPFSWALCDGSFGFWNLVILSFGHIAAGFSWTGVAVGQGNIILANSTPQLRSHAIALSQAVIAIMAFVSQMAGGELMQRTIGAMTDEKRYELLFVLNGSFRLIAVLLLFFVKDTSPSTIRGFLRQIVRVRPKGVLAMRKLSTAEGVREKEAAIRAIGESGMEMAERELSQLLLDPSPRIRREAAEALGLVGGREAGDALINLIQNHPLLADEEMVEAIARIGSQSAVPALVSLLENPSSALRRASAKALGRLRSAEALDALVRSAANPEDAELRRASLQALREIGNPHCQPVVALGLRDSYPSVRIAAAETCAELRLVDCAPILRESLSDVHDETAAELAYALAQVGGPEDAHILLRIAASMQGSMARTRCLLGVAKIYGVESIFYKLASGDSMTRDALLMQLTSKLGAPVVRRAVGAYHRGDEEAAVRTLSKRADDGRIATIEEHMPEDAFLLAAALLLRD